MSEKVNTLIVMALLSVLSATPLLAQASPAPSDLMVASIQDGANHLRYLFTTAAEQMAAEDYTFRPTPEVRSFGEVLAHVVETNYWFCATAMGEQAPASGMDDTTMTRSAIRDALLASFAYCDRAYAAMTDEAKAGAMRDFAGSPRPALAVLNFGIYHGLLHWGNAITYMRLRGRVPPSN